MLPEETSVFQARPLVIDSPKRRCGRPCILCSACVAITLAVMVPVGLFVITPRVAQSVMDSSVFLLNNATVDSLSGLMAFNLKAHVSGDVSLGDPLPVGVTLHKSSVTLVSPEVQGCLLCPKVSGPMAKFDLPGMDLQTGDNEFVFEGDFEVQDLSVFTPWTTKLLENNHADIIVTAELHITAMGVLQLHLQLNRTLSCNFIKPFLDSEDVAVDRRLAETPIPHVLMIRCTLPDSQATVHVLA